MRFTLKNPRSLQYIDYQNVRKTEFLGCQSQVLGKGALCDKQPLFESRVLGLKFLHLFPDFGNDSPYLFTPMYEASFKGTKR